MQDILMQLLKPIDTFLHQFGFLSLGVSMFAESIGIPFASSFFVATAGHLVASGKISALESVAISTSGIALGSSVSYGLGYCSKRIGQDIYTKLFPRKCEFNGGGQSSRVTVFIQKYGLLSVFLAQLFGFTRTFISFPAGVMGLHFGKFLLYTALGGALFSCLLLGGSVILRNLMVYLASVSYSLPFIFMILLLLSVMGYKVRQRKIPHPHQRGGRMKE